MKNALETRLGMFGALVAVGAVCLLELGGGLSWFKSGRTVRARSSSAIEGGRGTCPLMYANQWLSFGGFVSPTIIGREHPIPGTIFLFGYRPMIASASSMIFRSISLNSLK